MTRGIGLVPEDRKKQALFLRLGDPHQSDDRRA